MEETIMVLHSCEKLTLAGASLASRRHPASEQWDHRNKCLFARVSLAFGFKVPLLQSEKKGGSEQINTLSQTFFNESYMVYFVIYYVIDSFTVYGDFSGTVSLHFLILYYVHFSLFFFLSLLL